MSKIDNVKQFICNNDDDLYIYFEMINQLASESILDVGMFLKRAGVISRQVKDVSVNSDILLDGVDFISDIKLEIYNSIYDNIYLYEDVMESIKNKYYDLVIMLNVENILSNDRECEMWNRLPTRTRFVLTDCNDNSRRDFLMSKGNCLELTLGKKRYVLVEL